MLCELSERLKLFRTRDQYIEVDLARQPTDQKPFRRFVQQAHVRVVEPEPETEGDASDDCAIRPSQHRQETLQRAYKVRPQQQLRAFLSLTLDARPATPSEHE